MKFVIYILKSLIVGFSICVINFTSLTNGNINIELIISIFILSFAFFGDYFCELITYLETEKKVKKISKRFLLITFALLVSGVYAGVSLRSCISYSNRITSINEHEVTNKINIKDSLSKLNNIKTEVSEIIENTKINGTEDEINDIKTIINDTSEKIEKTNTNLENSSVYIIDKTEEEIVNDNIDETKKIANETEKIVDNIETIVDKTDNLNTGTEIDSKLEINKENIENIQYVLDLTSENLKLVSEKYVVQDKIIIEKLGEGKLIIFLFILLVINILNTILHYKESQ